MTATDCDLLLTEIIARPDDDTLRLVYADALDERGGREDVLRAELVRTMIDLHRSDPAFRLDWGMNASVYDNSYDARIRRTADLVRQIHVLECQQGRNPGFAVTSGCVWRRGFVDGWTGEWRKWAEFGDGICAANPVRTVTFDPFYPADFLHLSAHYDDRHRFMTLRADWKCPGKETVRYDWAVPQLTWMADQDGTQQVFRQEVRARTVGVLKRWWPTVEEFKWK